MTILTSPRRHPGFTARKAGLMTASSILAIGVMTGSLRAQEFTGNQTTSGPFSTGTQTFHDTSALNASAANAVSGGFQDFYDSSMLNASAANAVSGGQQNFNNFNTLNASAANAVSGGLQNFDQASALNASVADAISGGSQTFIHSSTLNASAANAISGGGQVFRESSELDATAANAVNGGAQEFHENGELNASVANAVSGGTQYFSDSSMLNASAANSVSGGTQNFYNTGALNASVANAVSGGTQNFYNTSTLNASAANAVSGGNQFFYDSSALNASAANAVSNGAMGFQDASVLNASAANAVSSGFQTFNDGSALNASASNAVSGGQQFFNNTSALNASAADAVSGGTQNFFDSSKLNASAANAVSGGTQNFREDSALNASVANAVNGGTQSFVEDSILNASTANAVSGGEQTFKNTSALNASAANAISGGTQYFYDTSTLKASAANAVSDGTQTFYGTSTLNASAVNAVNGGEQDFYFSSVLNASAANAVSGGTQTFYFSNTLNALVANAVSGGVQSFQNTSTLEATAANAVSGGYQYFTDTSALNATTANAVSGGQQTFYDSSTLNASAANAVSGGAQYFYDSSTLNASVGSAVSGGIQGFQNASALDASAANAVSGGDQSFYGASVLNASATNAVSGGTQTLYDASVLNVLATNALTNAANINFDHGFSVTGGALVLNGYSTVVGGLHSLSSGAGIIENTGAQNSILTVDTSVLGNSDFSGLIRDGGVGTLGITKTGTGELTLSGANTYTGGTEVSAGTLHIASMGSLTSDTDVASGASLVNEGMVQKVTNAGTSSNSGTIASLDNTGGTFDNKTGGTVSDLTSITGGTVDNEGTLGGNAEIGGAGTLVLKNGSVTGSVTDSGLLTGVGSVGNTTIKSGGTVAPGANGLGTLAVNGTFTQEAGSTYQVVVDPASNVSNAIVATQAADITGATLNVAKTTPGTPYQLGAQYTVLTATEGVTGSYNLTGDTALSAFAGLIDVYDSNHVYLKVTQTTSFTSLGGTSNQTSTAAGLQSLPGDSPLLSQLALNLPSDAAARAAFDQLSGEIHPSIAGQMVEDSRFVRDAALDRLTNAFCGVGHGADTNQPGASKATATGACAVNPDRIVAWGHGFGSWGEFGSDGNAASMSRSIGGFIAGLDVPIGDDWRAGILAGYSQSSFSVNGRGSSGTSNDYSVGLYGGRLWDALSLKLGAAYTWHDIDTDRAPLVPGIDLAGASASYNAGTAQAFGELGYRLQLGGLDLEPFANLALVNQHVDDFGETGGDAALWARSQSQTVGFSTLGLHAATNFDLGSIPVTAKATIGWRHAFGDVEPSTTFNFAGGSPFTTSGLPIARDAAVVDAGLAFQLTQNTALDISYGGQFSRKRIDQSVTETLSVRF